MVGTLGWGGIYGLYAYRALVRSLGRRVPELPLADALSQRVGDLRVALSDDAPLVQNAQTPGGAGAYPSLSESAELNGGALVGQSSGASFAPDRLEGRPTESSRTASHNDAPLVRYARQEFETGLAAVRFSLEQYRTQLLNNPDQSGQISDSRQEWETLREIDILLDQIDNTIHDPSWLLDMPKRGALKRHLDQLQLLAAQLPTHLYRRINDSTIEAKRQYQTLITLSWSTCAAAGIMLGLFVHLFYNWIFRPLRILIGGSRKVARGQFDYRIRLQTHDEMSELAAAMNDMTARFQEIRDDLDRQVQERTKQAIRSEQLASVGFLAAGVAHEINNPLASIAMCAESLEGRIAAPAAAGAEQANAEQEVFGTYLRMIQSEAFRCKEITEKLLDFARLGEVKRQPTELGELVRGVIDIVGHIDKYRHKKVEFQTDETVVVSANPQELKQVVLNLLANAFDSFDDGGAVRVSVRRQRNEAEIVFADDGCGMTPEVLEHLFEPFFTRRRVGQGTGLGLSIVYRIVADHQGSIEVHSDGPQRGSTFRVRLPLLPSVKAGREKSHGRQAA